MRTGRPILYTSADSVFQVATHELVVPLATLYDWCERARLMLVPPNNVNRVIARPFVGSDGMPTRAPRTGGTSPSEPPPSVLDRLELRIGRHRPRRREDLRYLLRPWDLDVGSRGG